MNDTRQRPSAPPEYVCDRCGAPMEERKCKIVCQNCGLMRDCSDP
jgi:DNA-directed RNA polymerase subunit RPC12/RpoP